MVVHEGQRVRHLAVVTGPEPGREVVGGRRPVLHGGHDEGVEQPVQQARLAGALALELVEQQRDQRGCPTRRRGSPATPGSAASILAPTSPTEA